MDEIFLIIKTLIKDGIDWREALVFCTISITSGLIIWALTTGLVAISKCLIGTIENIATSIIKRIKETTNSFFSIPSNQAPKL